MPLLPSRAAYRTRWKELVGLSKHQIYISNSHDPFLNLSIEHYLLQKSHPDSTILFLYRNAPCIVIGRNQNPWLEVNFEEVQRLRRLEVAPGDTAAASALASQGWKDVSLVRRRSGGGTVVHDLNNVNFSVICPSKDFTRDKHSAIVTQAIREINPRARVNERHDIVLDQGDLLAEQDWPDPKDMHRSMFRPEGSANNPPLKVSGSAYKLTRQRALHHGTCLLTSPNLARISRLLNSPARPFIKARGVDSVRSPVGNISQNLTAATSVRQTFERELIKAFVNAHEIKSEACSNFGSRRWISESEDLVTRYVGEELYGIEEIREGEQELKTNKWLYGQTPQFILSSHPTKEDQRARPRESATLLPPSAQVYLKAKSGTIVSTRISRSDSDKAAQAEANGINRVLKERNIHNIQDFRPILKFSWAGPGDRFEMIASWLNTMLGKPNVEVSTELEGSSSQ